jgi:hypothetical protein
MITRSTKRGRTTPPGASTRPDGNVVGACADRPLPGAEPELARCAEEHFRRVRIPPYPGDAVTVGVSVHDQGPRRQSARAVRSSR